MLQRRESFTSEVKLVQDQIARLEHSLDDLRIAPLRAALTFLQIGEFEYALNKLIDAEAANPLGAVPKFWLALLLFQRGQEQVALEKLEGAMLLNPDIVHLDWLPPSLFPTSPHLRIEPKLAWCIDFKDSHVLEAVPPPKMSFLERLSYSPSVRLMAVGSSERRVILLVDSPSSEPHFANPCLYFVDAETGRIHQALRLPKNNSKATYSIVMATPRIVLIYNSDDHLGTVFDALSATRMCSESWGYLQIMLCPMRGQDTPEYRQAKSAPSSLPSLYKDNLGSTKPPDIVQEIELCSVHKNQEFHITVKNEYEGTVHYNSTSQYSGHTYHKQEHKRSSVTCKIAQGAALIDKALSTSYAHG